jgi:uncharacterized protein YrrD
VRQTVSELKRFPVFNRRGEKLGAIDDVVLDADDWSVRYAVLRYEVPGQHEKLLGVALEALVLDSENECLVVTADDDSLRDAPGIDRDSPPPEPSSAFKRAES